MRTRPGQTQPRSGGETSDSVEGEEIGLVYWGLMPHQQPGSYRRVIKERKRRQRQ